MECLACIWTRHIAQYRNDRESRATVGEIGRAKLVRSITRKKKVLYSDTVLLFSIPVPSARYSFSSFCLGLSQGLDSAAGNSQFDWAQFWCRWEQTFFSFFSFVASLGFTTQESFSPGLSINAFTSCNVTRVTCVKLYLPLLQSPVKSTLKITSSNGSRCANKRFMLLF